MSRLIQSDPVTCARHFDYQFNQFLRHFLMSNAAPLGKIADWFFRVEYQQRGSPHIHIVIWLEDALVFGCDDDHDEKAVETLACSSCSHSISRSPKLSLIFL